MMNTALHYTPTTLGQSSAQAPDASDDVVKAKRSDSLMRRFLNPAPSVELVGVEHEDRAQTESFVRDRYHSAYQARVDHFMPLLLTMRCLGANSGVAGMRPADSQPLYLEQYLESSVEACMQVKLGEHVERNSIVEIGNLVAAQRGASHLLFLLFTSLLHRAGYQWIVFTATRSLRNNLQKLGFELHELRSANPQVLDEEARSQWGSYYETEPVVMAGRLDDAMSIIQSRAVYRRVLRLYRYKINYLGEELASLQEAAEWKAC